jgi:hypothetical protein
MHGSIINTFKHSIILHNQAKIHERLNSVMAPETKLNTTTDPNACQMVSLSRKEIKELDSIDQGWSKIERSSTQSQGTENKGVLRWDRQSDLPDMDPVRTPTSIVKDEYLAGITEITEIVYWVNDKGAKSHCLARLYQDRSELIVILSEIKSNVADDRHNPGISSGFAHAANALYKKYPDKFSNSPESILWVSHYGSFSNYEIYDFLDEFNRESLCFNEKGGFHVCGDEQSLDGEEFEEKLGHIKIEDVRNVLKKIQK